MSILCTCLFSARCACVQARLREEVRASHFLPKGSKPPTASVRLQICIDSAPVRLAAAATPTLRCIDTVGRLGVETMTRARELVAGTGGRQDRSTIEKHTSERRVQDSQEQI